MWLDGKTIVFVVSGFQLVSVTQSEKFLSWMTFHPGSEVGVCFM